MPNNNVEQETLFHSMSPTKEEPCLIDFFEKPLNLRKKECLFKQGDIFDSIYIITSGSIKTFSIDKIGKECITGFYYKNDIVGLSAIESGYYSIYAKTLEASSMLKVPLDIFEIMTEKNHYFKKLVLKDMSKKIAENQKKMVLLGKRSDVKIAGFLLDLSIKINEKDTNGFFRLSMSRNDIGDFLGLTVETISRTITKFKEHGLIKVQGKHLLIINLSDVYQH